MSAPQNFVARSLPTIKAEWLNLVDKVKVDFDQTSHELAENLSPADSGRLSDESGIVYLSRYIGWDPTGVTSSRTAFLNALELVYEQGANHVDAAQIGGRIIVPYGIALLDNSVPIISDNIEIIGGHGATIRTNGAFPAFTVEANPLQKIYGTLFRGLRFTSTVVDRSAGSGAISAIDAEMLRILWCKFHLSTQYAVKWENAISSYIENCDFDTGVWGVEGAQYGLWAIANATSGCNASHVVTSTFRRTTIAGVALLGTQSGTKRECAGNSIAWNDFEHNYGDAIQLCRNRALDCNNNWIEDNGLDAAVGHAAIKDTATDDDENATSGVGCANSFTRNVFGSNDNADAGFSHLDLTFQTNPYIGSNYFTAGNLSLTATLPGLTIENNWGSSTVPVLIGALPTFRYFRNNRLGPTTTFSAARPWNGSFYDYDPQWKPQIATDTDTTPSLVAATFGRIHTLLLSNTVATTLTYLDDGYEGMIVRLIATNGNSTLQNGVDNAFNLAGAVNYVMSTRDSITLMLIDTGGFTLRWIELGRSEN